MKNGKIEGPGAVRAEIAAAKIRWKDLNNKIYSEIRLLTKNEEINKEKNTTNKTFAIMAPVTITPKNPNMPATTANAKKSIARFNIQFIFKMNSWFSTFD